MSLLIEKFDFFYRNGQNIKCHMGKVFVCTGFQRTMVEDHCVKAAKDGGGGGKTLAAKMPLSATKRTCRQPLNTIGS